MCSVSLNILSHLSLKHSNSFFEVICARCGLERIKNNKPIIVIFQLCSAEAFFAQTAECVTRSLTFCHNHEFGLQTFFFSKYHRLAFLWKLDRRGEDRGKDNVCASFLVYLRSSRLSWTFMISHDLGEKERPPVYSQAPNVVARD